jgi:glucose/mannose-6-phosphate isomerase
MNKVQIEKVDGHRYYDVLCDFDGQLRDAQKLVYELLPRFGELRPSLQNIRNITVCGMGGSAIAGDFIKQIFSDELHIPVLLNRDYHLPAFIDAGSLVIVSSYSGNTEETLSAFHDAIAKNAKVISISTGGKTEQVAKTGAVLHIAMPPGFHPRQAVGYSLVILYSIVAQLFTDRNLRHDLEECVEWIGRKRIEFLVENPLNAPKRAAENISKQAVVIYASERMLPAAVRLKGQICENAKLLAFANAIPEMTHNEIVGWDGIKEKTKGSFDVILLRDAADHDHIQKRFEFIKHTLSDKAAVFEFWSEGNSLLLKFLSLIYFGDWLSFYLAIDRNEDPTPIDVITRLKLELDR